MCHGNVQICSAYFANLPFYVKLCSAQSLFFCLFVFFNTKNNVNVLLSRIILTLTIVQLPKASLTKNMKTIMAIICCLLEQS